jgi:hypothetical protein
MNVDATIGSFDIGVAALECTTHQRDGVWIEQGFPGSGISMFKDHINWSVNASTATKGSIVNHVAHEMSHYFFGRSDHFADIPKPFVGSRSGSSFKTYVGGWRGVYSGYEKYRLGWMQPTPITVDGDSYILWDLATTMYHPAKPRLYKINIPGTSQFFLVENRRWISQFEPRYSGDSDPDGLLKPGILI